MTITPYDLTTGSIPRHLARLSIPMVWGILSIVSMQLVDVYFVAGLGQTELESIGFTFPVSMVIFNLVMGLSIGTSSVCSRLIGAQDMDTFKRFIVHAMAVAFLTAIVLVMIGLWALPVIFSSMGAGPEHMVHILPFMQIQLWGYVFITVPLVLNAALRAQGDTRLPAAVMVAAAIINIPLAYGWVYGAWGFPALGMMGAGLANVCANAGIALIAFLIMTVGRRGLHDRAAWTWRGFSQSLKRLLPIAIPVGLMNVMGPLATAIVTTLLATSGAAAVAAYGIVGRIEAISAVVLMAVSIGMSPLVGQNYGAGKYDRVAETLHTALTFCILWSVLTGLVLMLMGPALAAQFSTDAATITIVASYFWIMGISRALPNIVVGWGSLWYAMGKPKFGVINNLSILGMGTILPALIGHALGGWYGLFLAMMMGQIITGLALHFWSAQQFKNLLGRF